MSRSARLYIGDIIENIVFAEEIVKGCDFLAFVKDRQKNYAVIRCVEIIGEATKNVPEEIRAGYPEIPWRRMAGMRDKIIHFYMGVDYRIVWQAVTVDLPALKPNLESLFDKLPE